MIPYHPCQLQQPIRQGRFPVINVSDDAEVTYMVHKKAPGDSSRLTIKYGIRSDEGSPAAPDPDQRPQGMK
jgi:hypothetical protein